VKEEERRRPTSSSASSLHHLDTSGRGNPQALSPPSPSPLIFHESSIQPIDQKETNPLKVPSGQIGSK